MTAAQDAAVVAPALDPEELVDRIEAGHRLTAAEAVRLAAGSRRLLVLANGLSSPIASDLAMRLTARSNRAAAIFGSRHAHLRPPLAAGERLVMLAGCFHVAG